jgi:hypothetical protein
MSLYTERIAAFENDMNDAELDDDDVMRKLDMKLLERVTTETQPLFFFFKKETEKETFDLLTDRVMQEDFDLFFDQSDELNMDLEKIYTRMA